jgi:lipoprotein-anchoring transpeptidase ErfK/SrfK
MTKLTSRTVFSFIVVLLIAAIAFSQGSNLTDDPTPTSTVVVLDMQPVAHSTKAVAVRPTGTATLTATSTAKPTLTATSTPTPTFTPTPTPTSTPTSTPWPTGTVHPPAAVGKALVVDQEWQVLRVYEDGREVRTLPASTGQAPYYTPAFTGRVRYYVGTFYSFGVWADDAWYVFMAAGEIYIHSLPYTKSGDEKIYEGAEHLGVRPSSHGCIRLHPDDAAWLTAWNPGGVPIVVTPPLLDKEW